MRINVEFPADDVTLRGWLYTPQNQKGPFPLVVATLGSAGLMASVYDHRCHGESDGLPRSHIDPWAQIHGPTHRLSPAG